MRTPWGDIGELKERNSRRGPGTGPADRDRDQRERLFGAMVIATAEMGYPAVRVEDLLGIARVSRGTFYRHFDDKGACFRATVEALLEIGLESIASALQAPHPWERRLEEAVHSVLALVAAQPVAARICLLDSYAAGLDGTEPVAEAMEQACGVAHEALLRLAGHEKTPPDIGQAVIGGLHRVLNTYLWQGRESELPELAPQLVKWATSFPPPVPGIDKRSRQARMRAPLEPVVGRDLHERMIRTFAEAVGRYGLPRTTISQIAATGSISQATFYKHFRDKDDALEAALDLSGTQLVAAALPAARRAQNWPQAIHRALEAICRFLVAEPSFARLRAVEVYAAGPRAIIQRDVALDQIVAELIPEEVRQGPGELSLTASGGAIYALIYKKVQEGDLEKLPGLAPTFSYLLLSPLLGPEEAARAALTTIG
jgi:AcrR family transcriptional regulator